MRRWITDLGSSPTIVYGDGEERSLGRYGVWESRHGGKPEVVETGDDLEALQERWGPGLKVSNIVPVPDDA